MKEKIYIFVIGLLLGGIIATGGLFIYQKVNAKDTDTTSAQTEMQMPAGDNSNGQMPGNGQEPPAKPGEDNNSDSSSSSSSSDSKDNTNTPPAKPDDSNSSSSQNSKSNGNA